MNIKGEENPFLNFEYYSKSYLNEKQNWEIHLPIWLSGFNGKFRYGEVKLENAPSPEPHPLSSLFSNNTSLEFYYATKLSFRKDKWLAQIDVTNAQVGKSVDFLQNDTTIIQASFNATIPRLFIGYKLHSWSNANKFKKIDTYICVGTRWYRFLIKSQVNPVINNLDIDTNWFDFIVGLNSKYSFRRWLFDFHGDIGFLGNSSTTSYTVSVTSSYKFSRNLSFKLGWQEALIKHSTEISDNNFTTKVRLYGPHLGLGISF